MVIVFILAAKFVGRAIKEFIYARPYNNRSIDMPSENIREDTTRCIGGHTTSQPYPLVL